MKLFSFFLLSILLNFNIVFSQNKSVSDSLRQLLQTSHDINKKTELNFQLAKNYLSNDLIKSNSYGLNALYLMQKTKNNIYAAKIYSLLGDIAIMNDSIDKAKDYYEEALTSFKDDNNKEGIVIILTVLGNIAFEKDNLSKALQYYQQAIVLATEENYTRRLNMLFLNIGSILTESGQYIESQQYFSKALESLTKLGDSLEMANAYRNLAVTYFMLNDDETAVNYLNQALEVFLAKKALISLAGAYIDLSQIEYKKENYNQAIKWLDTAQELIEENNSRRNEGPKKLLFARLFTEMGTNFLAINQLDSAYFYLKKGLHHGVLNRQLKESGECSKLITKIWQKRNNSDSALYYHILFKSYSDSLFKEMNNRKLAYQEAQFKFEQQAIVEATKRNKEIEKHNRNVAILILTVIFLALLLILLVLLLRLNKIKMKKSEIEQQNLLSELELKNKELTTYLIYQLKNNEFVLSISEKLKTLLWKGTKENKALVNELIREIETDSSSDNWDEFILRFQQVHTGFYKNLGEKYPGLTSNELRLCAFLKLNMNTKDIAAITYQSQKSITVARWRLRQKLGLKKEERLSAFLSQF